MVVASASAYVARTAISAMEAVSLLLARRPAAVTLGSLQNVAFAAVSALAMGMAA